MLLDLLMQILAVLITAGIILGAAVSMAIVVFCYSALVVNFLARRQGVGFTFYDTKVYDRSVFEEEVRRKAG